MRNYLFSISAILFLFILGGYTPVAENETSITASEAEAEIDLMLEEALSSCNLSFTYQQNYSCCNTTTDGCACVDITVQGLYAPSCQTSVTDIWFESIFLCSQGPWSGVSPTIRIYLDLYAACPSKCQFVNIPVTMKYTYTCGWGTCQGSYSKTVKMLLC